MPKVENHAKEQAIMQLANVRALVSRLRVAQEQAETGPDETEAALRNILEDALCVETRSVWTPAGQALRDEEFRIVLCTGGPHVEIHGVLDQHRTPTDAVIRYQDWFTEIRDLPMTADDRDAVLEYARQFCF